MLEHGRDVLQLSFAFFVLLSLTKAQSPPPWTEKFQQAFGQLREGNIVVANHQFDALRKSEPQDFVLSNAIGAALDSTGHHREATEWYQRSLDLNPRFAPACNNLALNYIALGDAHWFLAGALQHLGRRDEAQREGAIVAQRKEALRKQERRLRDVLTPLTTSFSKD